jgi:hypothetical protein
MTDRDQEPAMALECLRDLEQSIREAREDYEEYFKYRPGADERGDKSVDKPR